MTDSDETTMDTVDWAILLCDQWWGRYIGNRDQNRDQK